MNETAAISDASAPTITERGNIDPITFEADAVLLPVIGELPAALNGTLYRIGPNPQFPQAGAHWFGGDGMLHAFHLQNGRASYRNRWVHTAHFKAERAAGRRLFGSFGQPDEDTGAAVNVPDEGAANTNIVWHGGRLLALEEAHLPIEIEPTTLATRGPFDFGGALPAGPFTAHPKTDPVTGELLFFGYGASGPLSAGMTFGVADSAGRITRFDRFDAPFASMVHDFAVTEQHVLFPVLPLTASMARAERGLPPFAWEPQLGSWVGVLRRDGDVADIRWFRGDAGFVFHVMNTWEARNDRGHLCIFADVMRYDEPPLFPHSDGRPTDPERSVARLCRWTFDLDDASNRFTQTPLDDLIGEFPRIDERRAACGVRRAACGVRRAACGVRGYPIGTAGICAAAQQAVAMREHAPDSRTATLRTANPHSTGCRPGTACPSRCLCRAVALRPKAMAGCWPPSIAAPNAAATWRCSMRWPWPMGRWRPCNCRTACRPASMATGYRPASETALL